MRAYIMHRKCDKKYHRRAKNRESRRRQRQSGAAENRAAGHTARRCDCDRVGMSPLPGGR